MSFIYYFLFSLSSPPYLQHSLVNLWNHQASLEESVQIQEDKGKGEFSDDDEFTMSLPELERSKTVRRRSSTGVGRVVTVKTKTADNERLMGSEVSSDYHPQNQFDFPDDDEQYQELVVPEETAVGTKHRTHLFFILMFVFSCM